VRWGMRWAGSGYVGREVMKKLDGYIRFDVP
jgi:hypothetical protein